MIPLQILLPSNVIDGFKLNFYIMEIALVYLEIFYRWCIWKNYYHLLEPALINTFLLLFLLTLCIEVLHHIVSFIAYLLMSLVYWHIILKIESSSS